MDLTNLKYIVVGSGFFGSVIAERAAHDKDEHVVVIDKRGHFGGNCFSQIDEKTGIEFHKYGTHVFHTSNEKVWKYIKRFTVLNGYRHQVLSVYKNRVYQMPINLETINSFYGINLRPFEVDEFLKSEIEKEGVVSPQNFEEKAISLIGRALYEAFIKGYTEKMWQKDPKSLPVSILARLPVRRNYDENYFFDQWQGIPLEGYSEVFRKMLSHKNIDLHLNVDFFEIKDRIPESCLIIYSGPIDSFFDYKFGKLEWRSVDFERQVINVEDFQGTSVMNYPELSIPYIRIHEPRHLHIERNYTKEKTLILIEYPKSGTADEPYYPVNTLENHRTLQKYLDESKKISNVIFGGRLGEYKYYDMDQTIGSALDIYEKRIKGMVIEHGKTPTYSCDAAS